MTAKTALLSFLLFVVLFIVYKYFLLKPPVTARDIDANQFEEKMKLEDAVILDVRSAFEFRGDKIKGAQHLSSSSADFREKAAQLDKDKTYLVYCSTGSRSADACNTLSGMGFDKVFNLTGGLSGWESAGKQTYK